MLICILSIVTSNRRSVIDRQPWFMRAWARERRWEPDRADATARNVAFYTKMRTSRVSDGISTRSRTSEHSWS